MANITATFGTLVFNDAVMKSRLSPEIYQKLSHLRASGERLTPEVADEVAIAMRDWAAEKGATHYTHWFQPMTGTTAEKHEAFLEPDGKDGVILEFSGRELVSGEADASSFPSGGLRATFEARGYSAWDPTSPAFIKDGTLCIPTAFCSYTGDSLDKKTPMLRSMVALDREATRILRLFGDTETQHVEAQVGAEQEYFLIDQEAYNARPDLIYCGRTLFGARPPKGQEMDDHYYGQIKPRVWEFMQELDDELWKLGIFAKTEHNEVAPAQHELAAVYTTMNIATDQNQLIMEMMKKIAAKHGLACLLHEKPFAGVNGSGKHDNWSIGTDTGLKLFKPGKTPSQNKRFLLFLTAVIKAVDENQDLLRISVAGPANDHRLGGNEAPPAIISVFLGDQLNEILENIMAGETTHDRGKTSLDIGVSALPFIPKDTTDRNRTSPFAFTGNKFEFRMPGSSQSLGCPNMILNTILAGALSDLADELEKSTDFEKDLDSLIRRTLLEHKRIIFNGNNYSDEWLEEAERRGLTNYPTMVDALPHYTDEKNVKLFEKFHVLSATELHSRQEVLLDNYAKTVLIEAYTMIDLVKKDIVPAVLHYESDLLEESQRKRLYSGNLSPKLENALIVKVSGITDSLADALAELEEAVVQAKAVTGTEAIARFYRDRVFGAMAALRALVDELETTVGRRYWPFPTYAEMLFSVK